MLRCLNELDDNMFVFTSDATAMHRTVNTEKGITFISLEHGNLRSYHDAMCFHWGVLVVSKTKEDQCEDHLHDFGKF